MPDPSVPQPATSPDQASGSKSTRSATIGILTYNRPDGLDRCLESVFVALARPGAPRWTVSQVLVVDNDPGGSARSTAEQWSNEPVALRYVVEPTPGIAAARNRALEETTSEALVFIDDDEIAELGWPHRLLETMDETGAAMIGGPVNSTFTTAPPSWITDGGFFDRDDPPHGSSQEWLRSGNLVIDLARTNALGLRFDPRFAQGEDTAFTRLAKANGLDLRWSAEGAITEFVTANRFDVRWRLRREYLAHRGWTRSSLDLASTPKARITTRLRVLAAAGARTLTGVGQLIAGAVRFRKANWVAGLVTLVGVGGKLTEIVAYRQGDSRTETGK